MMSSYDPKFVTSPNADLYRSDDVAAALRAAADLPFQLRMHGMRATLFLGAAIIAGDDDARGSARVGMERAIAGIDGILAFMRNGAKGADCCAQVQELLCEAVEENAGNLALFRVLRDLLEGWTREITETGAPTAREYDALMRRSYDEFAPAMMQFTVSMTAAADRRRASLAARARDARTRAAASQSQIEEIARTVRLISLNARVEAARAGEAGRAFGVIAEEIRNLSEQTEQASAEIGTALSEMMDNIRMV